MNGQVPDWLAGWLGFDERGDGDVALWELHTVWNWAPWATVLLILLLVGWTLFFYRHESKSASPSYRAMLATLRLAMLGVLLFMLAEFALSLQRAGRPNLVLLVDRSASMDIVDKYTSADSTNRLPDWATHSSGAEPTRLDLAKRLLTRDGSQLLNNLADSYNLQIYFVAAGVVSGPDEFAPLSAMLDTLSSDGADRHSTRLGGAIRQVLEDPLSGLPAAVILLSDGINTIGPTLADAARLARRRGVPLFLIGIGDDQPPRDVEITNLVVDEIVFVDDLVRFAITLKSTGLAGKQARVLLRREGESKPLDEVTVELLPTGESQTIHLTHRPTEPGEVSFVVAAEALADEVDHNNNQRRQLVSVRDEQIRVLLAHAYPSYEFRYLKTLLQRDPTVELDTYLQEGDPEYVAQEESAIPSFPVRSETLRAYDVLLIGDLDPRLLPRSIWANVQSFVEEKGGGLALLAGPRYFPWLYRDISEVALLAPVELATVAPPGPESGRSFRVQPTPLGLRTASLQLGDTWEQTELIWRSLDPLYWLAEVGNTKPAAQVLAQHPTRVGTRGQPLPVICLHYFGNGRVLFHATDETWRWRFQVGDAFFARYWVQTIRLLARSKLSGRDGAELIVDRQNYRLGEPVEIRARFLDQGLTPLADDGVTVIADTLGQPRRRVTLNRDPSQQGIFSGSLADLPQGQYRLLLVTPSGFENPPAASFTVSAPPGETARIEMDRAALVSAADASRGQFYTLSESDRLAADLPTGRTAAIESLPTFPLWNRWWLLSIWLALTISEWILRRRQGML